jgi:hypothetical protein
MFEPTVVTCNCSRQRILCCTFFMKSRLSRRQMLVDITWESGAAAVPISNEYVPIIALTQRIDLSSTYTNYGNIIELCRLRTAYYCQWEHLIVRLHKLLASQFARAKERSFEIIPKLLCMALHGNRTADVPDRYRAFTFQTNIELIKPGHATQPSGRINNFLFLIRII